MINHSYPDSDITGKIIGCAMEVHKFIGTGFQEVIYQRALEIEMTNHRLQFCREFEMHVLSRPTLASILSVLRIDYLAKTRPGHRTDDFPVQSYSLSLIINSQIKIALAFHL